MSRTASAFDQPDLFGAAPQGDLFAGEPAPPRYAPRAEHVRSSLNALLARLAAAPDWWGWSDWDIARFRDRDPAYFCDLLADPSEASQWRGRLNLEIARLDAASGPSRPASDDDN